ncbi:MAG: hypothetical protein KKF62_10970 [Bacteroidetes bacterium]|nr:hypothetical protein [Bacteroidota bacterium]MBU1115201.1 hypothetical protein [Bacteroidota bacterium]MBU1797832.1 hypothetical protein [Bacteroidota bacterium]
MNKVIKIILPLIYLFTTNIVLSQVPEEIWDGIKSSLITKYGGEITVSAVMDVDKEKNEYQDGTLPITDPYGTLANSYLFVAETEVGGLLGVYKNSTILWDSSPIITRYNKVYGFSILGSYDLNNDGNIEIMVSSYLDNPLSSPYSIWIFSWDSQIGTLLNETIVNNDENTTYLSTIYSYSYTLDIIDIDGDGIYEIKGVDENAPSQTKTYSWDGQKYGGFGATMPEYLPKNLLRAEVNCTVSKSQYGLLFNYSVKNGSDSQQKILNFGVEKPYEFAKAGTDNPNNKWGHYYPDDLDLILWSIHETIFDFPFDFIDFGEQRKGYKLETDAQIIYIGNFYIQGKNGKESYDDRYLLENSFSGKTLCGKYPSDSFTSQNFIDTLKTYSDISYTLGWIKNKGLLNSLQVKLEQAKSQLEKGKPKQTINSLTAFINEVEAQNEKGLTSEAYALLKFNAEYLIEQLETN